MRAGRRRVRLLLAVVPARDRGRAGVDPQVPGIYDTREVFAPSISLLPIPDIKLTFGASFQTLAMQYPAPHDQAAHAFTFAAQYRREVRPRHGVRHTIGADYIVRDATADARERLPLHPAVRERATTRWHAAASTFGFHFQGGHISGAAAALRALLDRQHDDAARLGQVRRRPARRHAARSTGRSSTATARSSCSTTSARCGTAEQAADVETQRRDRAGVEERLLHVARGPAAGTTA